MTSKLLSKLNDNPLALVLLPIFIVPVVFLQHDTGDGACLDGERNVHAWFSGVPAGDLAGLAKQVSIACYQAGSRAMGVVDTGGASCRLVDQCGC